MRRLNYHHLQYFHAVAVEGHLGRTAEKLNVSQSALSIQIKQLEDRIGQDLFYRDGRKLTLTEAGRIALTHANRIFETGDALLATFETALLDNAPVRIGAVSTLSRNFQMQFLAPLLQDRSSRIELRSGNMRSLLADLETLELDVVLSTELPPHSAQKPFAAKRIDAQQVGLHGHAQFMQAQTLVEALAQMPLILPTDTIIRAQFEDLAKGLGVTPHIAADVDDMAMVRLLAREGLGVAVAPAVVLADEIANGIVVSAPFDLAIAEPFYAITLPRAFPHKDIARLLHSGAQ